MSETVIDTKFNVTKDTPPGKDPDSHSPTLRRYHKLLWSKPLPDGTVFELSDTVPRTYLNHKSHLGEFRMSSDTVIPSFWKEKRISHVITEISDEDIDHFHDLGYSIGAMMLFPGNRINMKQTINAARGFNHRIKDRFDFTVECIRRFYQGGDSPLGDDLQRYEDFFQLFGNFPEYIKFFLLDDIVSPDFSEVKLFLPFEDFGTTSPLPQSVEEYHAYMSAAIDFIKARNRRIDLYCSERLEG